MSPIDQAHVASLFEGSPAAIFILRGPDLIIALANAACLRVWGKSAAVIGKPLLVALPELGGKGFDDLARGVMTSGVGRRGDETVARFARGAGGEPKDSYFDFYYAPMHAADGAVEGVFVHGYEVTERVLARQRVEALRAKEQKVLEDEETARRLKATFATELAEHEEASRFRLLVETVKDYAIFMLDPAGNVATWNAGAQHLKGYAATEIIGKHFSTFYPDEDIAAGKCEMELEGATRAGRFEDEGWRLRKDGSRFWANVVITALHSKDGALVGFAKGSRATSRSESGAKRSSASLPRRRPRSSRRHALKNFKSASSRSSVTISATHSPRSTWAPACSDDAPPATRRRSRFSIELGRACGACRA